MRSQEVAFLLNPAFCGRVLYSTIKVYKEKKNKAFPFPLIYLVLPLVLHKETRIHINSKTKLQLWVQRYPQFLIDFPRKMLRGQAPLTKCKQKFEKCRKVSNLVKRNWLQNMSQIDRIQIANKTLHHTERAANRWLS